MSENYSTINNELDRINSNVSDTYDSLESLGATMPQTRNLSNLASTSNSLANSVISKFIPANTTYTIESDGSGDFQTLNDAISFLNGKWSNGSISIQFGNGTFNIETGVTVRTGAFNIPIVYIIGKGKSNTTINTATNASIAVVDPNSLVILRNFTVYNSGSVWCCLNFIERSIVKLDNLAIKGLDKNATNAINCHRNMLLELGDNIDIEAYQYGVKSDQGSKIVVGDIRNSTFKNLNYGWAITNGSMITGIITSKPTYTNVTTKYGVSLNSLTANGMIIGMPA